MSGGRGRPEPTWRTAEHHPDPAIREAFQAVKSGIHHLETLLRDSAVTADGRHKCPDCGHAYKRLVWHRRRVHPEAR